MVISLLLFCWWWCRWSRKAEGLSRDLDVEQGASGVGDRDLVVAVAGVDLEVVPRLAAGDAGPSGQPGHLDRAAGRGHVDAVGAGRAVHMHDVVLEVAGAVGRGQVD